MHELDLCEQENKQEETQIVLGEEEKFLSKISVYKELGDSMK